MDGDDGDAASATLPAVWDSWHIYLACFYWSMTTITTVGYGDICPESTGERIFSLVAMCIGGVFYGYVIGSIVPTVSSVDQNQRAYYEKMDSSTRT